MNQPQRPDPLAILKEWQTQLEKFSTESFNIEEFGENIAQIMSQMGIGHDADLHTQFFEVPLRRVEKAHIRLDPSVGHVKISALPPHSRNLLYAEVCTIGRAEVLSTTDHQATTLQLRQRRTHYVDILQPVKDVVDTVAHNHELMWNIQLSPNLPITLDIRAGFTLDVIDLQGLNVAKLLLDCGSGATTLTFAPATIEAQIKSGMGQTSLYLPDKARVDLVMENGAGLTEIFCQRASLYAHIMGGVGNCEITLPSEHPFRIQGESGLGNIIVPERVNPLTLETDFISESGTWKTHDYEQAFSKVDIRFDGGVGSLIVQEAQANA